MIYSILRGKLPVELIDIIFKKMKDDFNYELKQILTYKTVFIITENKLSFLILENNKNYYDILLNESKLNDNKYQNISYKKKRRNY